MAYQNVIYPTAPLMMTFKDWQRPERVDEDFRNENTLSRLAKRHKASHHFEDSSGSGDHQRPFPVVQHCSQERSAPTTFEFVHSTSANPQRSASTQVRQAVCSHVAKFGAGQRSRDSWRPALRDHHGRFRRVERDNPSNECSRSVKLYAKRQETTVGTMTDVILSLPGGAATSFYGGNYAARLDQQTSRLLNYYLHSISKALYPLEGYFTFNPVRSGWFPLALTDEVLMQTIICSAAVHLDIADKTACRHILGNPSDGPMDSALRQLQNRLVGFQEAPSDFTIAAVSCLVMTEGLRGNRQNRDIHLRGLQEMLRLRGGLEKVNPDLQMKIHRADIEGAVKSLSMPYLPRIRRAHAPIHTMIDKPVASLTDRFLRLLSRSGIATPSLLDVMSDLQIFSNAIQNAINHNESFGTTQCGAKITFHPRGFEEDARSIQRTLLEDFLEHEKEFPPRIAAKSFEQALRIAALLYVTTLTRGVHQTSNWRARSTSVIIRRFVDTLSLVLDALMISNDNCVLKWCLIIGGISCRIDSEERSWFIQALAGCSSGPAESWEDVNKGLKALLWVNGIHPAPGEALWTEAKAFKDSSDDSSQNPPNQFGWRNHFSR